MGDQNTTPYLDALLAYARLNPNRLSIPGHKGGIGADPAMVELVGQAGLEHDIPGLVEGIDVGVDSPFQQSQRLAAEAWGASRTWFLVNGASQGNQAACMVLAHMISREQHVEADVVMQRNVHNSAIDGMVLTGLRPSFVAPEIDPELGIAHCLSPASLSAALDAAPGAVAAYVVSPTYFGAAADIAGLAEVAHDHGVPLIADEAWGAHLRFSDRLPADAISCGADLVISSTHKMVGSLTQSAMLHLGNGDLLDELVVDRCVTAIETTSPNALLCGSLDAMRRLAATRGAELLDETITAIESAREEIRGIEGLDVLDDRIVGRAGVFAYDPLRLAIDVRGTGRTGYDLARILRENDQVFFELASENVLVATFSVGAPAELQLKRLLTTLRTAAEHWDEGADDAQEQAKLAPPPPWGPLDSSPRDAFFGPQEMVAFDEAEGRISAEALAAYPPGIPNVLPGERLTRETLDYIAESVAHGGQVRGASDRTLGTLRVSKT